jgi:hypothetical protein
VLFEPTSGVAISPTVAKFVDREYRGQCRIAQLDLLSAPSTPALFEFVRPALPSASQPRPGWYLFLDGVVAKFEAAYAEPAGHKTAVAKMFGAAVFGGPTHWSTPDAERVFPLFAPIIREHFSGALRH